jgi:hypothetical protein
LKTACKSASSVVDLGTNDRWLLAGQLALISQRESSGEPTPKVLQTSMFCRRFRL